MARGREATVTSPEPTSLLALLAGGLLLGARHSLDADHVAAVTAMGSSAGNWLRAARTGAFWAAGHGVALLAASAAVIATRSAIPESLTSALELAVGIVITILGVRMILASARGHVHRHSHGEIEHVHPHRHGGEPAAGHHQVRVQPFAVGMLHGLAGSGAVTLVLVPAIGDPYEALLYVAAFGAGAAAGMVIVSSVVRVPFAVAAVRAPRLSRVASILLAATTAAYGVYYIAMV